MSGFPVFGSTAACLLRLFLTWPLLSLALIRVTWSNRGLALHTQTLSFRAFLKVVARPLVNGIM
jgi:hypothetical protein